MASTNKDLANSRVQGQTAHPLDKMLAIAVRIAEREGLLLEDTASTATSVDEPRKRARGSEDQDRATA